MTDAARLVHVAVLALVVTAVPALGQAPMLGFTGDAKESEFGQAIDGGVDVNQDGVPDYVVGAPNHNVATVFSGADGQPIFKFMGLPNAGFGGAVAFLGDGDGDGFPDVIVGGHTEGPFAAKTGAARVFSGQDGSVLLARFGAAPNDDFGFSVAGGGDIDLDGFSDVAVGAPAIAGSGIGTVRVYSVKTGTERLVLGGAQSVAYLGRDVAFVPDQDLDGRPEILAGANVPGPPGSVLLYSGTGSLRHHFTAPPGQPQFGYCVASAGDLDGDGVADVAFPGSGSAGNTIWVYSGSTLNLLHALTHNFLSFGYDVAGIGDYDGDGVDDLAVGAPLYVTPEPGLVFVLSGASGATLATFRGALQGESFGYSVAPGGDLDGDGFPEVMAGAPDHYGGGRGHAEVVGACGGGVVLAYGVSCAINAGVPRLNIFGCPAPSATLEVVVEQGQPGGVALLAIGSSLADTPIGNGCSLYLTPWLTQVVVPLDAKGFVRVDVMLPSTFQSAQFVAQAFSPAPLSPVGYTATNAIGVKVP